MTISGLLSSRVELRHFLWKNNFTIVCLCEIENQHAQHVNPLPGWSWTEKLTGIIYADTCDSFPFQSLILNKKAERYDKFCVSFPSKGNFAIAQFISIEDASSSHRPKLAIENGFFSCWFRFIMLIRKLVLSANLLVERSKISSNSRWFPTTLSREKKRFHLESMKVIMRDGRKKTRGLRGNFHPQK